MAEKLRLGVIGASVKGAWSARAHLPAIQASGDVELTAVCTTKADSAEAARAAFGARLAFDDYRKMVVSDEIDAVAVVVRVPSHYQPVMAALEAGKSVYCEWPLGRTTGEAEEMARRAAAAGVVTAVGLQSRVSPTLLHMKELVDTGYVGEMIAVHVSFLDEGVLARPSNRTWQRDASLGANTLTIANGHTLDAMRFVAGDLASLGAIVETRVPQWLDSGTGALVDVTSPDNILVSGHLANGAVASLHVASIPHAGSGYRMEIYGRQGTLVVVGEDSPQMCDLTLSGAKAGARLEPIAIPARHRVAAAPAGTPMNVGQMYARFARAVRGGPASHPTFETAVGLHKVLDALCRASAEGRSVSLV